eukprot:CAMPEP_0194185082 /NCGR_PEP_ID=MMETSP0154-20130528/40948_1 /TAXON_ID=1049557 /ORGANISM="Thalassiothrix antarctica, Strain L6-D1" /LENGTH=331 /DNA_ID=CAMNT_0038903141 /DNA_START=68 /DNA_END=1063 /DNA_ORIENTATION=+
MAQTTTTTTNQALMEVLNATIKEGRHMSSTTNNNNNNNNNTNEEKQLAKIRELLLKGADANYVGIGGNRNTTTKKKWTPLSYACHHGHLQVTQLLVQHGANINGTTTTTRRTHNKSSLPSHTFTDAPLYCAVMNGHLKVVEYLLQQPNINVNIVNLFEETPLYAACMYGSSGEAVIERLLRHTSVNIDQANRFGETPLFAACRRGYIWLVRLLLQYGANIHRATKHNDETPLCIATLHEHQTIVEILLQHNNNNNNDEISSQRNISNETSSIKDTSRQKDDTPKRKKKKAYKSMMASMMKSTNNNKNKRDMDREKLRKVMGGGTFSKVDKI